MSGVIKRPMVSEKISLMNEQGVYTFEVDTRATKIDVRQAIEKTFRVKVRTVRTVICRGRPGSRRLKAGKKTVTYWKKAMVRLVPGDKIALFEGA